jgi:hypothetical protein
MAAGCRVAVGRLPNLWVTAAASRRVSAVQLRKVPGRAVFAVAVLGTTLLVEERTAPVPSESSHAVVVARILSPTPLMLGQRRKLQLQMGEKESGNERWSVSFAQLTTTPISALSFVVRSRPWHTVLLWTTMVVFSIFRLQMSMT